MPKPKSAKQFRFLEAVAHGSSKMHTSLTPEQAQKGLSEATHAERSRFAKQARPGGQGAPSRKAGRSKGMAARSRAFGG